MAVQLAAELRLKRGQRGIPEITSHTGGCSYIRGPLTKAGSCGSAQWALESKRRQTTARQPTKQRERRDTQLLPSISSQPLTRASHVPNQAGSPDLGAQGAHPPSFAE